MSNSSTPQSGFPEPGAIVAQSGTAGSPAQVGQLGQLLQNTGGTVYVNTGPSTWVSLSGGGGGGISTITSNDGTLTVTNATGPTTDLSAQPAINTAESFATGAVAAETARAEAAEALLAPLASPALTGTPTAPTAAVGTSTTQLATTAFVGAAIKPGQLLATTQYAPVSLASYVMTAALAKLDTTNLTISLTVPASGNVDIDVEFGWDATITTSSDAFGMGLIIHGTSTQVGNTINVLNVLASQTLNFVERNRIRFHLTGLTPGALQLDLAGGVAGTSGFSVNVFAMGYTGIPAVGKVGPLIMQAFAA